MKKILILVLLSCFGFANTSADLTSDDFIYLHVEDPYTWTSVFIVPEGKDLVLEEIFISDLNEVVQIRDGTGAILLHSMGKTDLLVPHTVIKDDLQIIADPGTNVHIVIHGMLVDEGTDLQAFHDSQPMGMNKNIFTKDDIDFIYFREFIIFTLVMILRFFEVVLFDKKSKIL